MYKYKNWWWLLWIIYKTMIMWCNNQNELDWTHVVRCRHNNMCNITSQWTYKILYQFFIRSIYQQNNPKLFIIVNRESTSISYLLYHMITATQLNIMMIITVELHLIWIKQFSHSCKKKHGSGYLKIWDLTDCAFLVGHIQLDMKYEGQWHENFLAVGRDNKILALLLSSCKANRLLKKPKQWENAEGFEAKELHKSVCLSYFTWVSSL